MIVVSHRGPAGFHRESDGTFTLRRGAGGVVSALAPLLRDRPDARWLAAALSDDDRAAVTAGAVTVPGLDLELLALNPDVHRHHYETISNQLLWFCFHEMFDYPREPAVDRVIHDAWDAFRDVNRAFADRIAATASAGEVILVQDLHLLLVPGMVRDLRPDLAVVHFTHTPFCGPTGLRALPDAMSAEILASLGAVPAGFHVQRWASAYQACARSHDGTATPTTFAATFSPDLDDLQEVGSSDAAADARLRLENHLDGRRAIVRVDRIEPSKNVVRGFLAFAEFLEQHPEWHDRVCFVANLNPSREALASYQTYRADVEDIAERINDQWARGSWLPVILDTRDDFPRSVAALQRADVILVNPIRDGLNLVAMEGPLVNQHHAALCLSREAGAHDLIGDHALAINPFDVSQTAEALNQGLTMDDTERGLRSDAIRESVRAHPPDRWLADLMNHARPTS